MWAGQLFGLRPEGVRPPRTRPSNPLFAANPSTSSVEAGRRHSDDGNREHEQIDNPDQRPCKLGQAGKRDKTRKDAKESFDQLLLPRPPSPPVAQRAVSVSQRTIIHGDSIANATPALWSVPR